MYLSQYDWITELVKGGMAVYAARKQAKAEAERRKAEAEYIARMQAEAEAEARRRAEEIKRMRASGATGFFPTIGQAGLSNWAIPAMLGVSGILLFLLLKNR